MTDENAAPSVATVEAPPNPQQFEVESDLSALSDEQLHKWRMTGTLPQKESKPKEESAPSASSAKETPSESAPVSEPGEPAQEKERKRSAEGRIRQLNAEKKAAEERAAKLEERIARLERGERPAEAKPAEAKAPEFQDTRPKPKQTDTDPDGTPKYKDYDEYLDARDEWNREQWSARQKFDQQEQAKKDQQAETERKNQELIEVQRKRIDGVRKKHADFDAVALSDDVAKKIPPHSAVDGLILSRERGFDVLYHLAKNPDELAAIVKLGPHDQAVEYAKIELSLDKPPVKPVVTKAPTPPREVAGRGTPPADELDAAIADDDAERYIREANRRELARRKGQ